MNPVRRWAPAVRVARREAWRAKGRSILVLVMIALPVLAVTAADVVIQTSEVKGAEALERRMGGADALVTVERGVVDVQQMPDPDDASGWETRRRAEPRTLDDVSEALGREVDAVEVVQGGQQVSTDAGATYAELFETDLSSPLTAGTFWVADGRVPDAAGEAAVNRELASRGPYAVGDELQLRRGETLTIVGIVENAAIRSSAVAVAPPGGFGLRTPEGRHTWLVDAGGPVSWDDVRALNEIGATVYSRAVLNDPPSDSAIDSELGYATGTNDAWLAVVALVVVMALLEVVLLAGPAFAVIARRLQRSLALMVATGATPPQARKVVLASGLVLGGAGAALGVGLGLLVAWLALPVVQRFSSSYLGPYDVPWLHLLGVAGFGLVSALLAAVVPAWIASRQDVVAVLAGRRGDRKPSLRSPLLGLLLLGGGVALAAYGAASGSGGEYVIAVSAIVAVLGMLLLIPVVVVVLARLARRLPLPLRFAVRDAARHRTRTVPAVAAVAATVAGVVALGIGNASDAEQSRATYTPRLAPGQAAVNLFEGLDAGEVQDVLDRYVRSAEITPVLGPPNSLREYTYVDPRVPGAGMVLSGYGSAVSGFPVSEDGAIPAHLRELVDDEPEAEQVLADGGAVVFTDQGIEADEVTLVANLESRQGPVRTTRATVPALFVETTQLEARAQGVMSSEAADRLGVVPEVVALTVEGDITGAQEEDVNEALLVLHAEASIYVERGYQADDDTVIVQLVLGALGAVLMLGGTLTATFLSLSDARPDLATLSAVGASPRARRAVAASYALVIALVGALLGVGVGLIPGIAVTYPLTGADWVQDIDPSLPTHFLAVPWLLIGSLVLALPLVTAALVGAFTRSRLPMVARID